MRARLRGFTVIEAMVVVAILAILAAFAAPAMNQLIRTQKVRSIAYDLFADLTYARSQAIARGHNVGIGSKGGTNWGINGWMVRDLTNGETLRDTGAGPKGLKFTADAPGLVFLPTGRTAANVSFTIAPEESAPDDQKRCVRISPSGRPNSTTGACP